MTDEQDTAADLELTLRACADLVALTLKMNRGGNVDDDAINGTFLVERCVERLRLALDKAGESPLRLVGEVIAALLVLVQPDLEGGTGPLLSDKEALLMGSLMALVAELEQARLAEGLPSMVVGRP